MTEASGGVTLHLGPGLVGRARRWCWRGHAYLAVEVRSVFTVTDGVLHAVGEPPVEPAFEEAGLVPYRSTTDVAVEGDLAAAETREVSLTVGLADRVVDERVALRALGAAPPGPPPGSIRVDPDGVVVLADDVDPGALGAAAGGPGARLRGDEWLRVRATGGAGELRARLPGWIPHVRVRLPGRAAFSAATRIDRVVVRVPPGTDAETIVVASSATIPLPARATPVVVWALLGDLEEEPNWPRSARDVALVAGSDGGPPHTIGLTELLGEDATVQEPAAFAGTVVLSEVGRVLPPPAAEPTMLLAEVAPPPPAAIAAPIAAPRDETVSLSDLFAESSPHTIPLADAAPAAPPMWPFATPAPTPRATPASIPAAAARLPWEGGDTVIPARGAQQVTMVLGEAVDAHAPLARRPTTIPTAAPGRRSRVRGHLQPEVVVLGDAQVVLVPWQVRPPRPSLTVVVAVRANGDDLATWSMPVPADDGEAAAEGPPDVTTAGMEAALQHAPFKLEADVLLRGHAHAPRPGATVGEVSFALGHRGHRVERRFAVLGRRRWTRRWGLLTEASAPEPFERVPLTYASAFGGPGHADNPRGKGHRAQIGDDLPQLENPSSPIVTPDDTPPPWSPAARPTTSLLGRSGTFDAAWRSQRFPWFPADFDWKALQLAPAAQRLPFLRGDEPFVVRGALPDGAIWEGALPGRRVRLLAFAADGTVEEHACRLDTVVLDADTREADLTFRVLLESRDSSPLDVARIVVVLEDRGAQATVDELLHRLDEVDAASAAIAGGATPPAPARRPPDLGGRDPRGIDLAGARLDDTTLDGLDFTGARLAGASLRGVSAVGTLFEGAELDGADLSHAELGGARLDGAKLDRARFDGCRAQEATFRGATGRRPSFVGADLTGGRFDGAEMPSADFTDAVLDGAVLDGAMLENARLLDARASGLSARHARLTNALGDHACLDRAVLDRALLTSSTWSGASLVGASLVEVEAEGLTLDDACCDDASFDHAALKQARLVGASCARTTFVGADLFGVVFEGATLHDADLRGSNLFGVSTFEAKMLGLRLDGAQLGGTTFPASATMLRDDDEVR